MHDCGGSFQRLTRHMFRCRHFVEALTVGDGRGSAEPHFFRPVGSNASMPIQRQDPRMQQGSGGMLQTYLSNNSYTAGHQGLSQGANYGMRSMDGSSRSITAASPRFPPTSYNTGTPNPFHQGGNSMASDLRRPNSSQGSYSNYQPQLAASGTAAQSRSSYLSAQYSSYTTPRPTSRSGTPVQDYSTISGSFRASGAQSAASYHDHARYVCIVTARNHTHAFILTLHCWPSECLAVPAERCALIIIIITK